MLVDMETRLGMRLAGELLPYGGCTPVFMAIASFNAVPMESFRSMHGA